MPSRKTYPIHQSAFFKVSTKAKLAQRLGLSLSDFRTLCLDKNYSLREEPKKNGNGTRPMQVPCKPLKLVQKRIKVLLSRVTLPDYVISNRKGFSHVDNARRHQENSYFITSDINKFFPNCKREHVASFCRHNLFMPPDVADLFSRAVTFRGFLPTGSPSSPILSYWMHFQTFDCLASLAERFGLTFSLYVDDLTFSSREPLPRKFLQLVKTRLEVIGLEIKTEKTKYYSKRDYKPITGAVLTPDNKIVTPNRLRKKVIDDFNAILKSGVGSNEAKRILGRVYSARQVEQQVFSGISSKVKNLLQEATAVTATKTIKIDHPEELPHG